MSGITVTVRLDDIAAQAAVDRLAHGAGDLTDLMDQIGAVLVAGAVERISSTNVAPDGAAWPKSLRAQLSKGKTLHDTGALMRSITEEPGSDHVRVGSNMIYAAVHQEGAAQGQFGARMGMTKPSEKRPKSQRYFFHLPWGDIPARPYLGISEGEAADIEDLSAAWFNALLSGGAP